MTIELWSADYLNRELGRTDVGAYASVDKVNKVGSRYPQADGLFGVYSHPGWRPTRLDDFRDWYGDRETAPGPNTPVRYYSTTQVAALLDLDPRRVKQWVTRFDIASKTPFPTPAAVLLSTAGRLNQDGWTRGQLADIRDWAQPLLSDSNRLCQLTTEEIVELKDKGETWVAIARRAEMSTTSVRRRYDLAKSVGV